jgi:hypothetical protein
MERGKMDVYFIRRKKEVWEELFLEDLTFFAREVDALSFCEAQNRDFAERREEQRSRNLIEWESIEVAYQALADMGIDPKKVLPYHKREWKDPYPYLDDEYVVDKIVVNEYQ